MAEQLDLTTPIVEAARTSYAVTWLVLDWTGQAIHVRLTGSDGREVLADWTGAPAVALMVALNKANLSLKSLQRRVLEQLVLDGKVPAGAVNGAPA